MMGKKWARVHQLATLIALLGFLSCSTFTSLDGDSSRRGTYDDYLNENLQVKRVYLKLREMASAKALKVTPKLSELQANVVPGFEVKPIDGKTLFVVSFEMPDWSRFSIADFKFFLGDATAKSVKEIMDGQLLQTLYPFSVPHDRAFIVQFDSVSTGAEPLKVQTSQGQFIFDFGVERP